MPKSDHYAPVPAPAGVFAQPGLVGGREAVAGDAAVFVEGEPELALDVAGDVGGRGDAGVRDSGEAEGRASAGIAEQRPGAGPGRRPEE